MTLPDTLSAGRDPPESGWVAGPSIADPSVIDATLFEGASDALPSLPAPEEATTPLSGLDPSTPSAPGWAPLPPPLESPPLKQAAERTPKEKTQQAIELFMEGTHLDSHPAG
jgi:hypothetical protein